MIWRRPVLFFPHCPQASRCCGRRALASGASRSEKQTRADRLERPDLRAEVLLEAERVFDRRPAKLVIVKAAAQRRSGPMFAVRPRRRSVTACSRCDQEPPLVARRRHRKAGFCWFGANSLDSAACGFLRLTRPELSA